MSVRFNYDLGLPIQKTEDINQYTNRKYEEGKHYDSSDNRLTIDIIRPSSEVTTYQSQYPHFCNAKNYHQKKKLDFDQIIEFVRVIKIFLQSDISKEQIRDQILNYNHNTDFTQNIGRLSSDRNCIILHPILPSTSDMPIEPIHIFDLDESKDLIFLKYLLFNHEGLSIMDIIITYEKTLNEVNTISQSKKLLDLLKEKFPYSIEILKKPLEIFNTVKSIPWTADWMKWNVKNPLINNHINFVNAQFDFPDNIVDILLKYISLTSIYIRNSTSGNKLKPIIDEENNVNSDLILANRINDLVDQILNPVNQIDVQPFIDNGIFTVHHDIGTQILPPKLIDFTYELFVCKTLDNCKISQLYMLGHEMGHLVMSEIFDNLRALPVSLLTTLPKNKGPVNHDTKDYSAIFMAIFNFDSILNPPNTIIEHPENVKYDELLEHDINARDSGNNQVSVSSEFLADYMSYIIIQISLENSYGTYDRTTIKNILKYMYTSVCDTYSSTGHSDGFVRTNFFVFNERLRDIILSGGSSNYQKYLKYKNKYLELKKLMKK